MNLWKNNIQQHPLEEKNNKTRFVWKQGTDNFLSSNILDRQTLWKHVKEMSLNKQKFYQQYKTNILLLLSVNRSPKNLLYESLKSWFNPLI